MVLWFALSWVHHTEIGWSLHLHPTLGKAKIFTQLSLVLFHRVQLTQPTFAWTFLMDESHVFCLAKGLGAAQLWPVRPHNLDGGLLLLLRIGTHRVLLHWSNILCHRAAPAMECSRIVESVTPDPGGLKWGSFSLTMKPIFWDIFHQQGQYSFLSFKETGVLPSSVPWCCCVRFL